MGKPLRLLIVDDSHEDAMLVERELKRGGFDLTRSARVQTLAELATALAERWDIIVCDYSMPELDAPRVLAYLREASCETSCIVVSGTIDEDMAVKTLRGGAQDFVTKQKLVRLIPAIERELREAEVRDERERAKVALWETHKSMLHLIESLPDGVIVHRDGVVVYANEAAAKLFAAPDPKAIHGRRVEELLSSSNGTREQLGQGLREERVLRLDGSVGWADVATTTIDFEETSSTLAVLRDASARRELTAKMIEVDRMISMSILAAGVGHEINNPLAYVVANVEYVKGEIDAANEMIRGGEAPASSLRLEGAKQVLDEALEGGNRIRSIVGDLRMFSSDDQAPATVDVRPILDSAVRMAAHEVRRAARVVKEYHDVPQVEANASRLGQVFLNLVVNAAQAVREHRGDNEIRLKAFAEADKVVIDVADTGPGIAPTDLSRIFVPFFTTKPPGEGSGLGLAICKAIVSSAGGDISVRSELGKGTCFRVTLPAARPS